MKLPWITRKLHRSEIESWRRECDKIIAEEEKRHKQEKSILLVRHRRELEEAKAALDPIIQQTVGGFVENRAYAGAPRFQVSVVIDPEFVMRAFDHGDSELGLRYFAERVGRMVEIEMRRINLWRAADTGREMFGAYADKLGVRR